MMRNSICGADCSDCPFQENCKGCAETKGRPFGREWLRITGKAIFRLK